mmetsp:Transcript_14029/g.51010  ORF Transcript_14029/g.51010 Transcript_14029/m.51010 type:complete len:397 (-) Transcript_14029:43-1233(-)
MLDGKGQTTSDADAASMAGKRLFCGAVSGLATSFLLHPLDVLKVRMQARDGATGRFGHSFRLIEAIRVTVRTEGVGALYNGVTPALIGSTVSWGLYFAAFENAKTRWGEIFPASQETGGIGMLGSLASGFEAGTLVAVVTNPIWVVKTRLQVQRRLRGTASPASAVNSAAAALVGAASGKVDAAVVGSSGSSVAERASATLRSATAGLAQAGSNGNVVTTTACARYRGPIHCVRSIIREEGVRGLYRGLVPSLMLVSHGAIQFMAYGEMKQRVVKTCGEDGAPASAYAAMGAASKFVALLMTYPFQVARTRLQDGESLVRMAKHSPQAAKVLKRLSKDQSIQAVGGTLRMLNCIAKEEGLLALYRGLGPATIRVLPQAALTFVIYESLLPLLGNGQ